jgi:predicted adenine nucleotide alpha hydrolase (AANH) superfamily ATPase
MKILLHACCANCLIFPHEELEGEGHELFGFWFNPNIHPYTEYLRRLEAVKEYEERTGLRMIYRDEYDLVDFLRGVAFREAERCRFCYDLRLEAAGIVAHRGKFDGFTSTLLFSKHQEHDLIRAIGENVGERQGVEFLYRDFREGWDEGRKRSHELGLYRQQYCGCIYSEMERYKQG